MSDPLTSFANEEDDIEKVLDEINDAQNTDDKPVTQTDEPTDVVSDNTEDTKVPDEAELKAVDVEDDDEEDEFLASPRLLDRPHSATSDMSDTDLLAKIEEEMGVGNDPKDLDIVVDNPEKFVKTMESYIAFSVKTKTTRSDYENPEYNVKRRYNDFLWLRQQLEEKYPYLIVPPLPEKHNLTIDRFDKEFIRFRQVALARFMTRISQHPVTSADEILQAFLTLEYAEFQTYKKKGTGILSRMTRSLTTMGGSLMLKNRTEEYVEILDYTLAMGERLGAFERISLRVEEEQRGYLKAMAEYVTVYDTWAEADESLHTSLATISKLNSSLHDDFEMKVNDMSHKVILPAKEYVLFAESIKGALARRDALHHELEIITEELVKCTEEKKKLEVETPGTGGFLSRSNTEEAIKTKVDKSSARITELESAHSEGKAKLEERNQRLKTDLERWHMNKKSDMKELLGGLAQRNIDTYDKHITSLEDALNSLKVSISAQ